MEHTKTPWRITEKSANHLDPAIVGKDGEYIICLGESNSGNAAFIVRACNSHEALVEAVEALNRSLGSRLRHSGQYTARQMALAALKLAKP